MIIITTQCFAPKIGGIESLMTSMAESFSLNDEKIIVLADGKLIEEDKNNKFEIIRFNSWKPIRRIHKARYVKKLIQENNVKAVYADSWKSIEYINFNYKKNIKIIVLAHGTEIPKSKNSRIIKKLRIINSYKKSNLIIANSQYTKDLMLASLNLNEKKIKIIHPGIDVYKEQIKRRDHDKVNKLIGNKQPKLITLARIEKRKGHEYVLRALQFVKKKYPNLLYLVAGSGPYLNEIKKLVIELELNENVKFLGWITEPEKSLLLQKSDIFIMTPTITKESVEGFGMAFLDASFHGLPVIGSRSGGIADAVKENISGFLCKSGDIEEIIEKITRLLDDRELRLRLGSQGKNIVLEKYTWKNKSKEYLSIIKK